jgi:endonuclease-8
VAGIGNVYKSETLFLCGLSPFARVPSLSDEALYRLLATARDLMRRNLGPGIRRTRSAHSAERLWVYRRAGKPCLRCATPILRRLQGDQARATFWCPRCQSAAGD